MRRLLDANVTRGDKRDRQIRRCRAQSWGAPPQYPRLNQKFRMLAMDGLMDVGARLGKHSPNGPTRCKKKRRSQRMPHTLEPLPALRNGGTGKNG